MESLPSISVIIPVYKAEAYLERCMDSFICQTYRDFEILLIDDGSPDRSGEICDSYACADERIRVFHKENGGVASARQCGLENACGKYVIHADPDDWVEKDMLEKLYEKAAQTDADMLICDFIYHYADHEETSIQKPFDTDYRSVRREMLEHLHGSCCNKLIKRKTCIEYDVKFDRDLSYSEDLHFHLSMLLHPIKVAYLDKAFYHYDKSSNSSSISGSYSIYDYEYDIKVISIYDRLLEGTDIFELAHNVRSFYVVRRAFYGHIFSSEEFERYCAYFADSVKYCIDNNKSMGSKDRFFARLMYYSCKGHYGCAYSVYYFMIKMGKLRRWMHR